MTRNHLIQWILHVLMAKASPSNPEALRTLWTLMVFILNCSVAFFVLHMTVVHRQGSPGALILRANRIRLGGKSVACCLLCGRLLHLSS